MDPGRIPIASRFGGTFEDPTSMDVLFTQEVLPGLLQEAVRHASNHDPAIVGLLTPDVQADVVRFYESNPTTELAIGFPDLAGGAVNFVAADLSGSDVFKTYRPGDANGDDLVTILGDGSVLVENLGQSGLGWRGADFDFSGDTSILGDGSILVENLDQGGVPALKAPALGTAEAIYDPATGEVTFETTGQTILGLLSTNGHLLAGGNDLGGIIDESLVPGEIGWLDFGTFSGTLSAGTVVAAQTDIGDLRFVYQNAGEALTPGVIRLIPEPGNVVLLLTLATGVALAGRGARGVMA